jgi:hypothetical protein
LTQYFVTGSILADQQGCQIFLGTIYQKWGKYTSKYTKWPLYISNGRKKDAHKISIKNTNIFHRRTLQNVFKILGLKINHLATLLTTQD